MIRSTGRQLIGAIVTAAGGWWVQTMVLADCSSFTRIILSAGFCVAIYMVVVVGLFRYNQPIKIAAKVVQDQLVRNR